MIQNIQFLLPSDSIFIIFTYSLLNSSSLVSSLSPYYVLLTSLPSLLIYLVTHTSFLPSYPTLSFSLHFLPFNLPLLPHFNSCFPTNSDLLCLTNIQSLSSLFVFICSISSPSDVHSFHCNSLSCFFFIVSPSIYLILYCVSLSVCLSLSVTSFCVLLALCTSLASFFLRFLPHVFFLSDSILQYECFKPYSILRTER